MHALFKKKKEKNQQMTKQKHKTNENIQWGHTLTTAPAHVLRLF